jgi:hippurate hydrolase
VANTGLQVELMGTGAAAPSPKLIALRADMDGLRMEESNMFLPYKSRNPGRAHMCGHDGHMASLVAAAALISSRRHLLPSNRGVRLLFQPAEEGPGGALPMMKEGCLEGVAEVYGVHNWPSIPLGTIHVRPGPVMARVSTWAILVKGRGSHASQPQQALDAISCGAAIVAGVNSIVSRSLSCHAKAVVSVTQFHAGDAVNVLPDTAKLEGTIRDFDEETCVPPPG